MNTNTNTNSAAFTRVVDDLLWLHAGGGSWDDAFRTAVESMVANYTADANSYSDGSVVWEEYEEFPGYYFATKGALHLPPHRRTPDPASARTKKERPMQTRFDKHINVVDAVAELIIQQGAIKFAELADYLETLGVNIAGDEELTGEQVNQPHVRAGTTLIGAVSTEYVAVVEALFKTRPVMLEIGDPASFASHEEAWWVAWAGHAVTLI